jgi:hypothetical protein
MVSTSSCKGLESRIGLELRKACKSKGLRDGGELWIVISTFSFLILTIGRGDFDRCLDRCLNRLLDRCLDRRLDRFLDRLLECER